MNTILAAAAALSDRDLLARLPLLAASERVASVELIAHLAALDARPSLYASCAYGSLFGYCTQALRLSEDAACTRIAVAQACRRFPVILDLLGEGSITLTTVRLLGRHLTAQNHESVLERARGRSRQEIEALVAELAPRPDIPSLVRKLPASPAVPVPAATTQVSVPGALVRSAAVDAAPSLPAIPPQAPRPVVKASAPQCYHVQFTIDQEAHDDLRAVQALLRREIPNGDPGAIFARAMKLLRKEVEKKKLGASARPRNVKSIRPRTDSSRRDSSVPSPYIPRAVKRAVWKRDGGQCAFVADRHRCNERNYLEYHHVQARARLGPATIDNISLRCRRHNQYEAVLAFGERAVPVVREAGVI